MVTKRADIPGVILVGVWLLACGGAETGSSPSESATQPEAESDVSSTVTLPRANLGEALEPGTALIVTGSEVRLSAEPPPVDADGRLALNGTGEIVPLEELRARLDATQELPVGGLGGGVQGGEASSPAPSREPSDEAFASAARAGILVVRRATIFADAATSMERIVEVSRAASDEAGVSCPAIAARGDAGLVAVPVVACTVGSPRTARLEVDAALQPHAVGQRIEAVRDETESSIFSLHVVPSGAVSLARFLAAAEVAMTDERFRRVGISLAPPAREETSPGFGFGLPSADREETSPGSGSGLPSADR